MQRFPGFRSLLPLLLVLSLLALTVPGAAFGQCEGVTYGAETPEALIEAVQKAAGDADMGSMTQYLSASDRAKAGVGLTVAATMTLAMQEMGLQQGGGDMEAKKAELAEQKVRLDGILDTYGVDPLDQETMGRIMQQGPAAMAEMEESMKGICTPGLVRELADFLSDVSQRRVTEQLESLQTDDVGPITVDGDTATSTIAGKEFRMNRIDGRWYVDISSTAGGPTG